uniref:Phospholipase B-like n=1 Tax=Acrobeloides nanus TaxID=290746 RepID=A0A914BUS0_9BILA
MLDGKPQIIPGFDCRKMIAVGRYKNSINTTGWSYLEIETKSEFDPDIQAYSAGVLEGILTKDVLALHLENTINDYCIGYKGYCKKLGGYLKQKMGWIQEQIENAPKEDVYWQAVKRIFLQLTGLWHGYKGKQFNVSISYDIHPIMMLHIKGAETYELEKKFNRTKDPYHGDNGKCSGLVKLAPNNADLFISQVTMLGFENLLRVLKLYKFGYDQSKFHGHTYTFSSYPGLLYSGDDFILMSSGLAAIETTMGVFKPELYDKIQVKDQLPGWVRTIVANQLADSAKNWCEIYEKFNSGTYNNQWVVLDYNKFSPGKELQDGLLYVLEQMPGLIDYQDMTWFLKKYSYFPSYNIPAFKRVSEYSGFDKRGQELYWFSWKDAPRAKIFARDHNKVVDMDSLTKLMRYNDYTHDNFSKCECVPPYTAEAAISSRGDLNPINGTYKFAGMGHNNHAALDFKGTNYTLFQKLRFRAWSGPTYDQVPAFQWSTSDFNTKVKHLGHPDLWKFNWVEYQWETFSIRPM